MTLSQTVLRILLPLVVAGTLLFGGVLLFGKPAFLKDTFWFWAPTLLLLGLFWFALRKWWSAWISPKTFLLLSGPILGLLLALQFNLPRSAEKYTPLSWVPPGQRELVDLSGTFKTMDGRAVSLSDFHDRILFLNLWATWCTPCLQEMPEMSDLYQEFSEQGLSVVAVTDEDAQIVGEFLQRNPYPFPILLDPENVLGQRLGVQMIPVTLVIDTQGRQALKKTGTYRWASQPAIEGFRDLLNE